MTHDAIPALLFCGYGQLMTEFDVDELSYLFEELKYDIKILEEEGSEPLELLVIVDKLGKEIVFERVERDEYIFVLEAESAEALKTQSEYFSQFFARYKLEHRIELYDQEDNEIGYFHYQWPAS